MTNQTQLPQHGIASVMLAHLLLTAVASADQFGPYTFTIEGGAATITGFDSAYAGELVVTNELGGLPVTTVGNQAFGHCAELTSLTLPDTVAMIGDYAFERCSLITNVAILGNITTLGDGAFSECSSLAAIIIPASTTTIGNYAFWLCGVRDKGQEFLRGRKGCG